MSHSLPHTLYIVSAESKNISKEKSIKGRGGRREEEVKSLEYNKFIRKGWTERR